MKSNINIWVLKPSVNLLWTARTKEKTEFIESMWIGEWIIEKLDKGDVIIVEQLHVNGTSEEE